MAKSCDREVNQLVFISTVLTVSYTTILLIHRAVACPVVSATEATSGLNLGIAMIVATMKAPFVALYSTHLRNDHTLHAFILFDAQAFVALLQLTFYNIMAVDLWVP